MKNLIFLTSNKGKLSEAREILKGVKIIGKNIDLDEIQSTHVKKVIKKKLKDAYGLLGKALIVEDTGLYIKCLNGFPGALIKDFFLTLNSIGISNLVSKYNNSSAYVKTYIGYYEGNKIKFYSGKIEGNISKKPIGKNGFGWDDIFIPKGQKKTFAQMNLEEKNYYSMRKIAFQKFYEDLKKDFS